MLDISDLIGIPYKEHGRTKEEGFDCYGLAIEVCSRLGFKLNDVVYNNHNSELSNKYNNTLNIIEYDILEEGTILEMQIHDELHIGVCLDSQYFIHATYNQGVRISRIGSIPITRKYTWHKSTSTTD